MNPSRVLFVTFDFGDKGGLELYSLQLANALKRLGHSIQAISVTAKSDTKVQGIPTLGMRGRRTLRMRLGRWTWQDHLQSYLKQHAGSYDFIVASHLYLLPTIAAATDAPRWVMLHGIEAWGDWSPAISQALSQCKIISAVSHHTADQVRSRLTPEAQSRLHVFWPAVDTELFKPAPVDKKSASPVLLTVGRLSSEEQYKGHDLVIRSIRELSSRLGGPVTYRIVGDGDDRPRLEKIARDEKVHDQVAFLGRVSLTQMIQQYNACNIFTMPSFVSRLPDGSWTGEGFGIVFIEAAACAKAVVAANQGGVLDAVQNNQTGLLVEPRTDALVDAYYHLLTQHDQRLSMGAQGRQRVLENFTLENQYVKTRQLIETC